MRSDRRFVTLGMAVALMLGGRGCGTQTSVLHPTFPGGGLVATGQPVPAGGLQRIDGMFNVNTGSGTFGDTAAVHATSNAISIFTNQNSAYAVMRGACLEGGTKLVLEGSWRFPDSEHTGLVRLYVGPADVARSICAGGSTDPITNATLEGSVGNDEKLPSSPVALAFDHPLKPLQGRFVVVGHHGACATVDDCGASENSLESIRMTTSFGANVVEIDVQISVDGVPFLYHDTYFSERLAQGPLCHGPVYLLTFANIRANCKLKFGETIPTLDEALDTVLADPDLRGVWLDLKTPLAVWPTMASVTKHGGPTPHGPRGIHVVMGLADEDSISYYLALPPPAGTLCIVELSPEDTRRAGCQIWGPAWNAGPDQADIASLQAEQRAVTFWTIDDPVFIDQYLTGSTVNGFISNRPGLVFHRFQTLGTLPPTRATL